MGRRYNDDMTIWMPEFVEAIKQEIRFLRTETTRLHRLAAIIEARNRARLFR